VERNHREGGGRRHGARADEGSGTNSGAVWIRIAKGQNFCHLDPNTSNGKIFATFGKWQKFYSFALLLYGSEQHPTTPVHRAPVTVCVSSRDSLAHTTVGTQVTKLAKTQDTL
jgi:hypothetical protein